ncbi:hypothetical protein J5N97_030178 [Dioscorea zingiberensis]|uniref:Disease resistance protein RGA3 n=1 Tax=Dioscorea zingiberensis TaxID=325984 RepID=A0A9D5BXA2_9LILI|nr:hypothetical protein J5N97_030178 [Dioscorea zingiberensis]
MDGLIWLTSWLQQTIKGSPSSSSSSSSSSTGDVVQELHKLEGTLMRITAFLRDAEEREVRDESVKLWLRELKAISYQADDLLDEYRYELLRLQVEEIRNAAEARTSSGKGKSAARISGKRKSAGDHEVCISTTSLFPSKHLSLGLPDDMLDRIKKIRERFDDIAREREKLNLADLGPRRYCDHDDFKPLPTSSLVDESGVFGRDHDKKNLIESLFSDMDKKLSVIPIVGMGGLGKTTLAQLVYNDSRVRQHFDQTAWVCVSTDFDVTRLTKAIAQSLNKEQCFDSNELDILQRKLCDEIQDKKVLIVLDDVWSDDQTSWELLQKPFGSAKMMRIIVTTREESVARIMQQPGSYSYRPCILSEEQSWLLFKRRVFLDGGFIKETPYLVEIGKQIAQKCAGLPLALKAIGGVLLCEKDESKWRDILDSPIWDEIGTQILPVLKLSYDRMPSYLKPCFSLCSMFPKDYAIEEDMLIGLWVANGYIQGRGSKTMQDIGEDYVNELRQRSVIQNAFCSNGIIMHDMVHDVALSISEDECCAVVFDTAEVDKCPEISSKVRHLFVEIQESYSTGELMQILSSEEPIHLRTLVYIDQRAELECEDIFNKFGSLRALILIHSGSFNWDISSFVEYNFSCRLLKHLRYLKLSKNRVMSKKNWVMLPESIFHFYNLQILDVPDFCGDNFPDNIGNLINLRYLKLGQFARFPESMGNLINLQYFVSGGPDLYENHELLPQAITKLVNLRHLQCGKGDPLTLPLGIGNLINLRKLPGFNVGSDQKGHSGIRELKTLEKLRGDLEIYALENVTCVDDAKAANLACKPDLESLSLYWSYGRTSFCEELDLAVLESLRPHTNLNKLYIGEYNGCRLPSWLGDPSFCKLTSISLRHYHQIHDFRMLSQLTSLTSLELYGPYSCSLEDTVHDFQLIASSPSLESLTIGGMLCWQSWDVVMEKDFPRLAGIEICSCHNLRRLPSFQSLVWLKLSNCDNLSVLTVHFDSASPSRLRELDIQACPRLEMIEGLGFLTSLETFKTRQCGLLQGHVFRMLSKLPSLTSLKVDCDPPVRMEDMEHDFQLIASPSLKSLTIYTMLCSWNVVMENDFPSLTSISINSCRNLWRLPSFQSQSLVSLELWGCDNLRVLTVHRDAATPSRLSKLNITSCPHLSMIEGLRFLTSLETLLIIQCPLLQIPTHDCLPIMPQYVGICDGGNGTQGKHWCSTHGHNYNQFYMK